MRCDACPKIVYLITFSFLVACQFPDQNKSGDQYNWLQGSNEEKFQLIYKQFRGFDMAMVETGYRYAELYWAGKDQNWGYAAYQVDKIRLAIENGLQRRPARAASAQQFLNETLPAMKKSVEQQDSTIFAENFGAMTTTCNACHAAESVAFFVVQPPQNRQSPIRLK